MAVQQKLGLYSEWWFGTVASYYFVDHFTVTKQKGGNYELGPDSRQLEAGKGKI